MRTPGVVVRGVCLAWVVSSAVRAEAMGAPEASRVLKDGWTLQSSCLVKQDGPKVSSVGYAAEGWYATSVPSTVLATLVRHKVYPDPRFGIDDMRIPDASDAFNQEHNLLRFSHLPDKRNPWKDPWWYRTEFDLPKADGRRAWLTFHGLNYRADVWVNGRQIADRRQIVGAFSRYRLDITDAVRFGQKNALAVLTYGVDHPGKPDTQFEVFGKDRQFRKDNLRDVSLFMSIGYDCMPTVRDRVMGLWQKVTLDLTGPVDLRDPFVLTTLPLPRTDKALLKVSAELLHAGKQPVKGVLRGTIDEANMSFEKAVELSPGQSREVVLPPEEFPQLAIAQPKLWWPVNYGPQNLYHLTLQFDIEGQTSDIQRIPFGIRQITKVLHRRNNAHGLQLHINGQKIFLRGGYIQPEILYDWDARRMDTEVRYLTAANLNLALFEDVPNPPDELLDAFDRRGLLYGKCFYGCYCFQPDSAYPDDLDLLERSTVDILKRYRNHPSLWLYMAMNEGETREAVYTMWRKHAMALDGTRILLPSGSFPDYRGCPFPWFKGDLPTGMNDYTPKSYGWQDPSQYFTWVREADNWMFMMESGSASLPPIDSLRRFIPDLGQTPKGVRFPLNPTWAHHGANHYYKPYDDALRALHGQPTSVADYCLKGHLVTADQHRAMFEAANHRMWEITSGFSQWKVNACWPSVQWQIYDWFLKPMVSTYAIKNACEPLHVQSCPLDATVQVINNHLCRQDDLEVRARLLDPSMRLRWEGRKTVHIPANCYRDVLTIPSLRDLADVYFIRLDLSDHQNRIVSRNFYAQASRDFKFLQDLPLLPLQVRHQTERAGDRVRIRVSVKNPGSDLAFFVHLAATHGRWGEEILPVFWDDNYFSLLPHEEREITAVLDAVDVKGEPAVEVGGWNILSDFQCARIDAPKDPIKVGEPVAVIADIRNTFIDGSPVPLVVNGTIVEAPLVWARAGKREAVRLRFTPDRPGRHTIRVGKVETALEAH